MLIHVMFLESVTQAVTCFNTTMNDDVFRNWTTLPSFLPVFLLAATICLCIYTTGWMPVLDVRIAAAACLMWFYRGCVCVCVMPAWQANGSHSVRLCRATHPFHLRPAVPASCLFPFVGRHLSQNKSTKSMIT